MWRTCGDSLKTMDMLSLRAITIFKLHDRTKHNGHGFGTVFYAILMLRI